MHGVAYGTDLGLLKGTRLQLHRPAHAVERDADLVRAPSRAPRVASQRVGAHASPSLSERTYLWLRRPTHGAAPDGYPRLLPGAGLQLRRLANAVAVGPLVTGGASGF